ncbi:MAG: hypothetical protein AMS15_00170 [Planctomycetes bacterium DG_23]|nr:MAG: hypothetical protein AMS15_00170 [Planctomycetes bacterium DG_23]
MSRARVLFAILIVVCLGLFGVGPGEEGFGSKANAQDEGLGFYSSDVWTLDHEGVPVRSIAFSPDEKLLATALEDGSTKIWDAGKGALLRTLEGHSEPVLSLSFSPGGEYLASGSADGAVKVWKVREARCLYTFEGHKAAVKSLAFSPDGKLVASGSEDKTVRIWDLERGKCRRVIEEHTGAVNALVFYPDGSRLVTAGEDMRAMLWLPGNWPLFRELTGHRAAINSLWVSPDGNRLASASGDGKIIFWDVPNGMPTSTLGLKPSVNSITFSPDGKALVAAASSKNIPVCDAKTGRVIRVLEGHEEEVTSVLFSPKGRLLASASRDGKVNLWEVKWRNKLTVWGRQEDRINSISFSPDGRFLALGYLRTDEVRLLDMRTGRVTKVLEMDERGRISVRGTCLRFSPDGKILAVGGFRAKSEYDPEFGTRVLQDFKGIIILWDGEEKRELPEVDMPGKNSIGVTSLSFSADGRLLAAGYDGGQVRIWDVAEEKCLWTFTLPFKDLGMVRSVPVSLSPDGHFVAAGGRNWKELENSPVMVWDVITGEGPKLLRGLGTPMNSISFSPDGSTLVASGYSGNTIFWDVATWRKVRTMRPGSSPEMAFSPDGKLLATATGFGGGKAKGKVSLFDVEKGRLIKVLGEGGHPPGALAFSPDGATLVVVYNIYEAKQMARGTRFIRKESYLGLWWLPGCLDQWPPE